jgi:uncharacterized protein YqcC (DUF446 family)
MRRNRARFRQAALTLNVIYLRTFLYKNVWDEPPPSPLGLELFERLSKNSDFWDSLRPEGPAFSRRRVYTLDVVIRLMILQWVLPGGTLSEAIQHWLQSQAGSAGKTAISPCAGA